MSRDQVTGVNTTGMFLVCLVVAAPFYFAIKYWYVVLPVVVFALVLATIGYVVYRADSRS